MKPFEHATGKRGRSKARVSLTVSCCFEALAVHVWEWMKRGKEIVASPHITHTFYPTREWTENARKEIDKHHVMLDAAEARRNRQMGRPLVEVIPEDDLKQTREALARLVRAVDGLNVNDVICHELARTDAGPALAAALSNALDALADTAV